MRVKQPLLLIILLFMAGCAPKPVHNAINQYINWSQESPESIKERIRSSAKQIDILSAFFSLNMNPPPAQMMSSMTGVITIDNRSAQPKVRIRAFHLFGSTLFDMVNTDTTKIYVPRKNTMYVGRKKQQDADHRGPDVIFSNMMLVPSSLIIQPGKELEISKESVKVYLRGGWITLDKKSGLITARQKDNLEITYSAYAQLENQTLIPTKISIKTTDNSYQATCTLSKISSPESLPKTYFDLAEYTPQAILDLEDLQ